MLRIKKHFVELQVYSFNHQWSGGKCVCWSEHHSMCVSVCVTLLGLFYQYTPTCEEPLLQGPKPGPRTFKRRLWVLVEFRVQTTVHQCVGSACTITSHRPLAMTSLHRGGRGLCKVMGPGFMSGSESCVKGRVRGFIVSASSSAWGQRSGF